MYNICIGRWDFVRFNVLNASSFIPIEGFHHIGQFIYLCLRKKGRWQSRYCFGKLVCKRSKISVNSKFNESNLVVFECLNTIS